MLRLCRARARLDLRRRPDAGRVCAGVADYLGLDVTVVRVIWAVVSVITGGAGVLAYLVAWAVIPDEGRQNSIAEDIVSRKRDARTG